MADEDEDYYLPLQDQRVFGAGIKRKRINFVPASISDSSVIAATAKDKTDIGSRYLSIVLPKERIESQDTATLEAAKPPSPAHETQDLCPICAQPTSFTSPGAITHESSIAHQVCLQHSHPPSHLSRSHVGVRYLSSYGWDPDSRKGLGVRQEGISVPIKAKEKKDTVGLRETVDEDEKMIKKKATVHKEEKVSKLNAKEIRLKEIEAKKRAERMRQNFYGPDLEKYLGADSSPPRVPGRLERP